jgi:conjugative relaxase-like TrwC/TraI family protein
VTSRWTARLLRDRLADGLTASPLARISSPRREELRALLIRRPFRPIPRAGGRSPVLGVSRIRSDRAAYYLSDLGRELPVDAAPAVWCGAAASGLGLHGAIDPDSFGALLDGKHPRTSRLIGSGRTGVAANDLTFATPKSVSVLFGLGGEDVARRIVAAHADAVAGALSYLEHRAVVALRRMGPERSVVPTSGMVAGLFTHAVNRNLDPHVHSHVVMANLVHGKDGIWSACDGRALFAHRAAASALYDAHLRHGLTTTLGVRWTNRVGRAPEIEGVPSALVGAFSSRAAEIRRRMAEIGTHSHQGARTAWAATRTAKERAPAFEILASAWRREAGDLGFGARDLAVVGRADAGPGSVDEHVFASMASSTPHGGVHRRDVVAAFARAAPDGVAAESVERLVGFWLADGKWVGVSEPLHRRSEVVPGGHLLRALGPRPLRTEDHEVWCGAARAIEDYRRRWGLTRAREAFGEEYPQRSLATLGADRLADFVRTSERVDRARVRLGRHDLPIVELGLGR